jgi:hypothetical protein
MGKNIEITDLAHAQSVSKLYDSIQLSDVIHDTHPIFDVAANETHHASSTQLPTALHPLQPITEIHPL